MKILYTYLLAIPLIFAIDMLWLGVFAKSFYQKMMSPLVAVEFNWVYATLFYILYFIGIHLFVLSPGIEAKSLSKTITLAILFGFFCYMTYDITNLATLKNWPLGLALADLLWGICLTAFAAFVAYKIYFLLP